MIEETQDDSNRWEEWNRQGLIPGPEESETDFIKRVTFCQHLKEHLVEKVGTQLPFELSDQLSHTLLEEVKPLTKELYGIEPSWVPVFCSNYQLTPWHGGCAWIFQLDEQTPMAAFLQLRAQFRTRSTYLGLYHRQELMAHELAHVGRMLYQDPQFEEILAYQSSSSRWRCWLGPIVQSSKESLLFILILGIVIMADLALVALGNERLMAWTWGLQLIPLALIALALGRLFYRQQLFKACRQNLEGLYQPSLAKHLLYRLRDEEIRQFARLSQPAIKTFIETAQHTSFRWRFLGRLYPQK